VLRDRDVRNAIQAALQATNAFDGVFLWGLPANYGSGASNAAIAVIQPDSGKLDDIWDGSTEMGLVGTGNVTLSVCSRNEDPQLRDEAAELLLDTAADAINGQGLAGLTMPDKTRVTAWKWREPAAPDRWITATVVYQYIVETWSGLGTSP